MDEATRCKDPPKPPGNGQQARNSHRKSWQVLCLESLWHSLRWSEGSVVLLLLQPSGGNGAVEDSPLFLPMFGGVGSQSGSPSFHEAPSVIKAKLESRSCHKYEGIRTAVREVSMHCCKCNVIGSDWVVEG